MPSVVLWKGCVHFVAHTVGMLGKVCGSSFYCRLAVDAWGTSPHVFPTKTPTQIHSLGWRAPSVFGWFSSLSTRPIIGAVCSKKSIVISGLGKVEEVCA